MSGGVDSSVAAALLKRQGYDIIGITLQLWPQSYEDGVKSCCGLSGIEDARRVAAVLGIPHYVLNFQEIFARGVIDNFIQEYKAGRTPNPCIRCNKYIKFGSLFQKADELDAQFIATGHYARIERNRRLRLKKGSDSGHDQSYFLYNLDQGQLNRILFPLGDLTKTETRAIASELGLRVAKKPASQEICFITDNDYRGFLKSFAPETAKPGPIYDTQGNYLGMHKGIAFYTMGQRKGLRIALGKRMYVVDINRIENSITLGEEKDGYGTEFIADEINLISIDKLEGKLKVQAKIRHAMAAADAVVQIDNNRIRVKFLKPQWAITPGQAAVFYDGDVVIGGGTITEKIEWKS